MCNNCEESGCIPYNIEPGTSVVFANETSGYASDIEQGKKLLNKESVYHVSDVEAHGFHTDIWLKEMPGVRFNSVQFKCATV